MRIEDPRSFDQEERTRDLVRVLHRLWTYSFTTKSDEARVFADEIAEAASRGFITTEVVPFGALHGRLWKLTPDGVDFLYLNTALIAHEQEEAYATRH